MAAKFLQWNTEAYTLGAIQQNRGQNTWIQVYPDNAGTIYANPPKFEEDLNAEEE